MTELHPVTKSIGHKQNIEMSGVFNIIKHNLYYIPMFASNPRLMQSGTREPIPVYAAPLTIKTFYMVEFHCSVAWT